jgi:hexulose-6-phosphate isomerase
MSAEAAGPHRYDMKKSINLWAFPYPQRMTLRQCIQLARDAGFEGIELNYDLTNDLSPKSGTAQYHAIRKMADDIGIALSGVCTGLWADYPCSSNDEAVRARGLELFALMIQAVHDLGANNLLTVPAMVDLPQIKDKDPVPPALCERRAREALGKLLPQAEKLGVSLNLENIFFNGFLMTPEEMNAFVDSFSSPNLGVHFDTGNVMLFQYPEHWVPVLGRRIRHCHVKEFNKNGDDYKTLASFRTLLDGSTNWPAVLDALERVGYRGYLTFEFFNPYRYHPEALIYHTSDALDRLLGRKHG